MGAKQAVKTFLVLGMAAVLSFAQPKAFAQKQPLTGADSSGLFASGKVRLDKVKYLLRIMLSDDKIQFYEREGKKLEKRQGSVTASYGWNHEECDSYQIFQDKNGQIVFVKTALDPPEAQEVGVEPKVWKEYVSSVAANPKYPLGARVIAALMKKDYPGAEGCLQEEGPDDVIFVAEGKVEGEKLKGGRQIGLLQVRSDRSLPSDSINSARFGEIFAVYRQKDLVLIAAGNGPGQVLWDLKKLHPDWYFGPRPKFSAQYKNGKMEFSVKFRPTKDQDGTAGTVCIFNEAGGELKVLGDYATNKKGNGTLSVKLDGKYADWAIVCVDCGTMEVERLGTVRELVENGRLPTPSSLSEAGRLAPTPLAVVNNCQ